MHERSRATRVNPLGVDPSAYPIVGVVRDAIEDTIGPSLVGLFVYGSFATGDFEPDVSDLDLIAALTEVPDEQLVSQLRKMHDRLAEEYPEWDDRIEVDYVSVRGLADCRTDTTMIARISPGEPLHVLEAGRDFLLDWYPARQDGISLEGPRLDSLIPPDPRSGVPRGGAEVPGWVPGSPRRRCLAAFTGVRDPHDVSRGDRPPVRGTALETRRRRQDPARVPTVVTSDRPCHLLAYPTMG